MKVHEQVLSQWAVIKNKFKTFKEDLTKARLANQKVVEKLTKQNQQLEEKQKIISELRKDHQKVLENFNKLQAENMSLNLAITVGEDGKLNELSKVSLRTKVRELITALESGNEEQKKWSKQTLERFINFEL